MKLSLIHEHERLCKYTAAAYVYRGMSTPEWEEIIRTGRVQSRGRHNYSDQRGRTYYGTIKLAKHYAIEVPLLNGHTDEDVIDDLMSYAGVIIEVPLSLLKGECNNHRSMPVNREYFHDGPLSIEHIKRAWRVIPTHITMTEPKPEYVEKSSGLTVSARPPLVDDIKYKMVRIR